MGSQDDFFEALGPTLAPPNDSPGFFTYATGLYRGADIHGRVLGVRGVGDATGAVGVEGRGGAGGNGVFGRGMNGIVGLTATAVRNPTTEAAEPAGVSGVGDASSGVGVRGESVGPNAGIFGWSRSVGGVGAGPGVRGLSDDGLGVAAKGDTGVFAEGKTFGVEAGSDDGTGMFAHSTKGPGLHARSKDSQAGIFETSHRAQIRLVPLDIADPGQFPQSDEGDLAVTRIEDPKRPGSFIVSLWFCIGGGAAGQSNWTKIN